MLTLVSGYTWYGKYGFRPVDVETIKYYNKNKMTKLNEKVIENAKKFIEKQQTLLVKDYLSKFIEEYDKTCNYFNDLGLYDFYRHTFELGI